MFNSPFTADELTHFWEDEDQMGFGERTRNAIAQCKIVQPSDLLKFKDLDEVFRYLRKPPQDCSASSRQSWQTQRWHA